MITKIFKIFEYSSSYYTKKFNENDLKVKIYSEYNKLNYLLLKEYDVLSSRKQRKQFLAHKPFPLILFDFKFSEREEMLHSKQNNYIEFDTEPLLMSIKEYQKLISFAKPDLFIQIPKIEVSLI